ncbi:MAG: TldD/PmbA family protein [Leptospiraceae bacterium]|nr:TldD/PmbA family protein [Leptospiraceae bacterium]MCP5495517.1 TldD/PmbA family protein [Leptospiraceae bacterium]
MKKEFIQKIENTKDILTIVLQKAKNSGLAEVEIYTAYGSSLEVSLEKNDINASSYSEETNYGIRVIANHCQGFVTTNDPNTLWESIQEAKTLAIVQNTPDEAMELPDPIDVRSVDGLYLDEIDDVDFEYLVGAAKTSLEEKNLHYPKVNLDSGNFSLSKGFKLVVSTKGIMAAELNSEMSANYMGMAVDGDDIGSFDYDYAIGRNKELFAKNLNHSFSEFLDRCMGGLGAKTISGFKGNILIPPESVFDFLGDLLASMTGTQIRRGRSKFGDKMGNQVASNLLTIFEDARIPGFSGSTAFDREGLPTVPKEVIQNGVLKNFFYNHFEAKKAGLKTSLGNASGGSGSLPSCGPKQLEIMPGETSLAEMLKQTKTILVNRFSGSSDTSSGDFSGVVKGGFLLDGSSKIPIKETLISGNIYGVLNQIAFVSRERKLLYSSSLVPWILIEGIDIVGTDENS